MIRLVLVKQADYKAVQSAADQTDIGNIFAIQQLDFSIETLLKTIVSHYGRPTSYNGPQTYYKHKLTQLTNKPYKPDSSFPRLFDEVVGIYRDQSKGINRDTPPLRQEIELIHDMRNDAQHNGVVPAPSELQRRIGFGESFIVSVLNETFGLNFDQIMLSSLIQDANVRQFFQQAEVEFNNNNFIEAIKNACTAFNEGMLIARDRYLEHRQYGRFSTQTKRAESSEVLEAIQRMRDEMEPLLLGVDSISYLEFRLKSPYFVKTISGRYEFGHDLDWSPSKSDAMMVLNFVFSTLLRWRI